MIVERHYDEEALINIAQTGSETDHGDPHLASCSACAETLESFREISDILRDDEPWNVHELREQPKPSTIARLRAFASMQRDEDYEAAQIVDELVRLPRETWCAAVVDDVRYHFAGVSRELVSRSEGILNSAPRDAMELAKTALALAGTIEPRQYEGDVVYRLRGAAARQYAYSLFYVGDPRPALAIVERGEFEYDRCALADYDKARLNIVRALVLQSLQRADEAIPLTREAARVFDACGDKQRYASALMAEAYLYSELSRYREALPIFRAVERMSSHIDPYTRATTIGNIGLCLWQTGNIADALASYQLAAALYDEVGNRTEAIRIATNVASILRAQGHAAEARRRFVALSEEARQLGLPYFAVMIDLELAEILLEEGRLADAERACSGALSYFQRYGITEAGGALTALAFLREAAAQRRLTREAVRHVRSYVERLERQPELLFAPPPQRVE